MMHPATKSLLSFFETDHLPEHLARVSRPFGDLARDVVKMNEGTPHPAEVTAALRKLLEAKDCAVRAALGAYDEEPDR